MRVDGSQVALAIAAMTLVFMGALFYFGVVSGRSFVDGVLARLHTDALARELHASQIKLSDGKQEAYRVLTAVDAALMVIDAANGIELQTLRLLQVCRAQNTPVITFVNKMDRVGADFFRAVSEMRDKLKANAHPLFIQIGRASCRERV